MLEISADPIGTGRERSCYVHPEDPRKAIKILLGGASEQTRGELNFYRRLKKRPLPQHGHVPRYYGVCSTNRGKGMVVELIRDYDGQISRPLNWYLGNGFAIDMFEPCLVELKQWLIDNLIVFSNDLNARGLLLQKTSFSNASLVMINGFGDAGNAHWLDFLSSFRRRRIERRWAGFIERVYHSDEVRAQREADDHTSLLRAHADSDS